MSKSRIIIIQNESQALPAIMSFFFSGIGQVIQGRMLAGLLWLFTEVILGGILLIITFGLGVIFTFFAHILCITDAATYKPSLGKKLGVLVFIGMLINGGGLLFVILFWGILIGSASP